MRAFVEPLEELSGFEEMTHNMQQDGLISITGCIDAQKPHMIYGVGNGRKNKIIVTFHEQKAKELYEDYRFFDPAVVYYPAKDVLFYQSDIRGNLLTAERIQALRAIHEQDEVTVITTFDALMNTMAPAKQLWDSICRIAPEDTIDLEQMKDLLVCMGYEKEYQVESMGQFAIRGGILDIFPLTEDNPVRIEMWGDEVDTIRSFDVSGLRAGAYRSREESRHRKTAKRGRIFFEKAAERNEDGGSTPCAVTGTGTGRRVGRTGCHCRNGRLFVLFL